MNFSKNDDFLHFQLIFLMTFHLFIELSLNVMTSSSPLCVNVFLSFSVEQKAVQTALAMQEDSGGSSSRTNAPSSSSSRGGGGGGGEDDEPPTSAAAEVQNRSFIGNP